MPVQLAPSIAHSKAQNGHIRGGLTSTAISVGLSLIALAALGRVGLVDDALGSVSLRGCEGVPSVAAWQRRGFGLAGGERR
ncbi:hypothetical protein F5Y17DRAFT_463998 [Xylariaceae sp. FL0594]|nr:hypothetical protein F5Y17DRAFT_463998 [Xylariaceae sp. FL0594]